MVYHRPAEPKHHLLEDLAIFLWTAVPVIFPDFSVKLLVVVVFLQIFVSTENFRIKKFIPNIGAVGNSSFGISLFWICKYFSLVRILNKPFTSVGLCEVRFFPVKLGVANVGWKQVTGTCNVLPFYCTPYLGISSKKPWRLLQALVKVQMLQKKNDPKKKSGCFKLHGVRLSNFWKVVPNSIRPTGRKEFEASIVPTVVLDQSFWPTSTTSPGEVGWLKNKYQTYTKHVVRFCWSGNFTMNTSSQTNPLETMNSGFFWHRISTHFGRLNI